ncbi:hypothetical protein [Hymenobacter siberiensis]|uniref:hypothetical protein n=1 Tax=Hymenobacter siberiensis TaxID=2848396 RepID=UPI001C1DF2C9|nr:hypothetical protein [Hymenobacter siberiensis]MBU6120917.1 hypothetical protein [Hymenobacter siberiensis]
MKKHLINLFALVLLAGSAVSCKKAYDNNNLDPLAPSLADIPVTVTNFNVFERFPVFFATAPAGAFTITFSIPADKGKIKEITKVTTGNNGLRDLQTGAPAVLYNYNTATSAAVAIPGNGSNTITFTSDLDTYTKYRTRVGAGVATVNPVVSTNPQAPTQIEYYFLLTLDNGTTIIPERVRVRVQ